MEITEFGRHNRQSTLFWYKLFKSRTTWNVTIKAVPEIDHCETRLVSYLVDSPVNCLYPLNILDFHQRTRCVAMGPWKSVIGFSPRHICLGHITLPALTLTRIADHDWLLATCERADRLPPPLYRRPSRSTIISQAVTTEVPPPASSGLSTKNPFFIFSFIMLNLSFGGTARRCRSHLSLAFHSYLSHILAYIRVPSLIEECLVGWC